MLILEMLLKNWEKKCVKCRKHFRAKTKFINGHLGKKPEPSEEKENVEEKQKKLKEIITAEAQQYLKIYIEDPKEMFSKAAKRYFSASSKKVEKFC